MKSFVLSVDASGLKLILCGLSLLVRANEAAGSLPARSKNPSGASFSLPGARAEATTSDDLFLLIQYWSCHG